MWRSVKDHGWKKHQHEVDWRRGDDGQFEWSLDEEAVKEVEWRREKRGYGWGGGRRGWGGGRDGWEVESEDGEGEIGEMEEDSV